MKKLCYLFAAIMTVLTIVLCSCGADYMRGVSERRSAYFTAANGGITATAVSGVREREYAADGVVGALKPYTLITIVPDEFDIDAVYTFTAVCGDSTFGGSMIVHPFAASFSAEIDHELTEDFTVTVRSGKTDVRLGMKSAVAPDMITYDRAIAAALTSHTPKGDYEIRARLIKNPLENSGICWHVAFIYADDTHGVLLDPVSAKVLAKK